MRTALVAMTTMLMLAASLTLAPATRANGQGVTVYLGYLPEVSTWGPYEASGQAYVNAGEGRAHITVDHMIHDPAIRYEVWLVRADDRDTLFSVGTFEVDSAGHADVELLNPDLKPAEFRFLVISAEPAPDGDPHPDARRTVAGVFPNAKARTPAGGSAGFDNIWAQSPEGTAGPITSGSASGDTPPSAAGQGAAAEASPSQASGAVIPVPPPRLPVTGGGPAPLAVLLTVAGAASVGLMVTGARRQRAAARVRRDTSRGDTR